VSPGKGSANIRGNLPWPANGVVNTYGNGVLIKASGGSEVRAVARGRVVYVDTGEQPPYFVRNEDFLNWYERWLDETLAGKNLVWFGFD